jgi:hypothetical protein
MSDPATDTLASKAAVRREASLRESEPITIPEKSWTEWAIALLLFIASCLYLRLFYNFISFDRQDEGIILQGAARIIQGQVLYRDFFTFYTPGSYYWMALLFRVFGTSILVGRAALMVYGGVYSSITFLLARRVASRANSLLAAFAMTVICLPQGFVVVHNCDSTLWACLALYCAVRVLEGGNELWIFATGSLAAVTCLTDQPKGVGLVLGLGVGFLILRMRRSGSALTWTRERLAAWVIGFCWPLIGTIIYFGLNHALVDMAKAMWWPFTHYSTFAALPYGWVPWWENAVKAVIQGSWASRFLAMLVFTPYLLAAILPLVMVGVLGFRGWRLCMNRTAGRRTEYYVLVSAVGAGLLAPLLATHRPDTFHLITFAPISFIALAWIFGEMDISSSHSGSLYSLCFLSVLASAVVCGIALLLPNFNAHFRNQTRRGVLFSEKPNQVVPYMQHHLAPGQRILAYPYLPLYYFLTDTYNISKYEWVQPGLHTKEEFNEVLSSLAGEQPDVVIFSPNSGEWLPIPYPYTPPEAFAAQDPVTDFIQAHYRPCTVLRTDGLYNAIFMVRKNLSCPHDAADE